MIFEMVHVGILFAPVSYLTMFHVLYPVLNVGMLCLVHPYGGAEDIHMFWLYVCIVYNSSKYGIYLFPETYRIRKMIVIFNRYRAYIYIVLF